MLGWIITALWCIGYTKFAMKTKRRYVQTMSGDFRKWRKADPIGMWMVWLFAVAWGTWHFLLQDEPSSYD